MPNIPAFRPCIFPLLPKTMSSIIIATSKELFNSLTSRERPVVSLKAPLSVRFCISCTEGAVFFRFGNRFKRSFKLSAGYRSIISRSNTSEELLSSPRFACTATSSSARLISCNKKFSIFFIESNKTVLSTFFLPI